MCMCCCYYLYSIYCTIYSVMWSAQCGSGVVRRDPLCFLAGCRTRRLNQAISVLYLSMFYCVIVYYGTFLSIVSFHWYVLCLLVVLVKIQYLPSDWLERLLWGSLTVVRGSSPKTPGWRVRMIFLVYSIVSLFNYLVVLFPCPKWYTLYFYDTI